MCFKLELSFLQMLSISLVSKLAQLQLDFLFLVFYFYFYYWRLFFSNYLFCVLSYFFLLILLEIERGIYPKLLWSYLSRESRLYLIGLSFCLDLSCRGDLLDYLFNIQKSFIILFLRSSMSSQLGRANCQIDFCLFFDC